MSLPGEGNELEQVGALVKKGEKAFLTRDFAIMNKQQKDPDDMFRFFNLNHKFARATEADKSSLRQATEGNDKLFSLYKMWYKYTKFYKKEHPGWVSSLVTAK
ncbi:uncharacterized protein IUM83_09214 [Phytophthora cinnamomi]|uniref:uncharacterized protein n=1 Tax=Phytophthora cinnamomi TaxID=4785 RepID=UPI0035595BFE|nr:hypothetical protein IUM83_09214 [Phytophthora cinnamomi]